MSEPEVNAPNESPVVSSTPIESPAISSTPVTPCDNTQTSPQKKLRLTSTVWSDFDRKEVEGSMTAYANIKNLDIRQQLLAASARVSDGKVQFGAFTFDQEYSRKELDSAIVLHEYPLSFVDHVGIRSFIKSLQPLFEVVTRNTIKSDILKLYQVEKRKMYSYLENLDSRIALTTDMWTSNQKKGYMAVTAHFIDSTWVLQSRILSFIYVPTPHTKEVLSSTLMECILDWNIDRKISTITVDNCSTNNDVFPRLRQHEKLNSFVPSEEEWELAREICTKMKLFYNATELFSGQLYPTSNEVFIKVCDIKLALNSWILSLDERINQMTANMLVKFDKYWNECHIVMAMAIVLDPRYKMKIVEYYFPQIYGNDGVYEFEKVRQNCFDLLVEYQFQAHQLESVNGNGASSSRGNGDVQDPLAKFDDFVSSNVEEIVVKSELDHYLEEKLVPRNTDIELLTWWKSTGVKYPTLQKIVIDILVIPMSTMASESSFSTSGTVLSSHRSKLTAKTVEALMCTQNWFRQKRKEVDLEKKNCDFGTMEDDLEVNEEDEGLS